MKKRILSLVLCLVLGLSLVPTGALAAEEPPAEPQEIYTGEGTKDSPYQIFTVDQLNAMRNNVEAYYVLESDLNLSGITWEPIGTFSDPFCGHFDGNGHSISNVSIGAAALKSSSEKTPSQYLGLFAVMSDATISNLELENVSIILNGEDSSNFHAGAIAAVAISSTITDCNVSYSIQHGKIEDSIPGYHYYIGGLIGETQKPCDIMNTTVAGDILFELYCLTSPAYEIVGGLVGYGKDLITCENVSFSGNVIVNSTPYGSRCSVGGFFGSAYGIDASECTIKGDIIGNADSGKWIQYELRSSAIVGGVAGFAGASVLKKVDVYGNCSGHSGYDESGTNGQTSSSSNGRCVGGLVGRGTSFTVEECTYQGSISGTIGYTFSRANAGGFFGKATDIEISNSSISADITNRGYYRSTIYTGGVVGNCDSINVTQSKFICALTSTAYDGANPIIHEGPLAGKCTATSIDKDSFCSNYVSEYVRYFSEWDAENQVAYFADMNIPLGAVVTEETDTSFIENIDSLLGQCVLVKTKSREDDRVGPDILLSISPVETKRGTVTDVDDSSITIDGVSYSLSEDWFWAKFYVDTQVIYYLNGSDIVGIEEPKTLTGTLLSWNAETGKISIDPDGLTGTTAYMLSPLADEGTIEKLEKNIGEDLHFVCDSNQFIYCVIPIFEFGKDNLSFTNNPKDFFNTIECIVWEKEDAEAKGKFYPLPGFVEDTMKDVGRVNTGTQISNEAFGRLISGMSNTVVHRIYTEKNSLWGGSCYGMAQVMAIRYLDPERLPLSEIDSSLNDSNCTYDLQAPKDSETTENLINYYSLSRLLPVNFVQFEKRGDEIAKDYTKSLESLISTIKNGIPVSASIALCDEDGNHKGSTHAVLLLDILGETEEYYGVKVCDPNETEYTTMRIYRQPGIESEAFAIEYYTDSGYYNMLPTYYSSLEEMDWRNYFGLDDNAGWLTDYDKAHFVTTTDTSVTLTCGDVELQYEDGAVHYSSNISNPYISADTTSDGKNSSEVEFLFDKPSKDSVSNLSVSSETGYVDTTLILDGWSAAIRSENAISVQANSQNQSVSIQSEDAGMISLLLTRNETAEDWPWYGIAVDVDDATELTVTPTDAGVQISSDNLDGAAVAGQSKDSIDSLTLNTNSKTVLLVNKTPSDSDSNYIDIIAEDVTVTFDPNGGTVTPVSAVTGEGGTLSSLPVPTRDGYIFNGWYSAPSGGNKITTSTVFATDTTVFAQWRKDTSGSSSTGSGNSTTNIYTISTSATENGSVSVSPKTARAGTTVTITATPDTGYQLDKLTVTDKNGNEIKLTDQGDGTYTFTMPASKVNISASFTALEVPAPALPFTDVTTSDWYYDAVAYVYDNGLMTGTSATTFSPKATTTRGMIVTILHRLEGCPAAAASGFADVKSGAWYQEAVDWAAANGIVNGTSATTFAPTSPITREQMAAILYRYAAYKGYDVSQLADLSRYSDSSAVRAYAADALAWANAAGLITGVTDTSLSPQGSAVRAQAATILMRFCENIAQ